MLNPLQKDAYDRLICALKDPSEKNRCFFLNGPAGSGKTFLYNVLIKHAAVLNKVVLPHATIGVATDLFKNGMTVHMRFNLPLKIDNASKPNKLKIVQ
jgi:tRNA A37 threonylcarbamoyladenosine biosynthesis protein TsaE